MGWMNTDTAASIMNVINPDNVQNVVYQDFQAEENPMTHEVIRTAGVIAAPVAAKPQINQTVMPGLQFPMFQAPLTANVLVQQQQPVMAQQQMVQQPVMAQQPMAVTNMKPMVHQQAPVVVEETQKTSPNPFGNAFDFLFSKN